MKIAITKVRYTTTASVFTTALLLRKFDGSSLTWSRVCASGDTSLAIATELASFAQLNGFSARVESTGADTWVYIASEIQDNTDAASLVIKTDLNAATFNAIYPVMVLTPTAVHTTNNVVVPAEGTTTNSTVQDMAMGVSLGLGLSYLFGSRSS